MGDGSKGSLRRPLTGVVASVVLHALLVAVLFIGVVPGGKVYTIKRGDTLFVELPEPERAAPGAPAKTPGPQVAAQAPSSPPAPPAPSAPAVKPAPRAKPAPPAPAARPTSEGAGTRARATPAPDPASPPAPAVARAEKPAPEEPARSPSPGADAPAAPANPQVASVPPSGPPPVDIRTAVGRGGSGAGGRDGAGRGGITGDPISLESTDATFSDYLARLKQQIQAKMVYPCINYPKCSPGDYKETSLIIVFGILKSGELQFIEVVRPASWAVYDEFSVRAVQFASPFPPVPAALMATRPPGATGVPIAAHFQYSIQQSFRSLVR